MNGELWCAEYLPASTSPLPSRYDFETRDEAEAYVRSQMCMICTEEYKRALAGTSDPNSPEHEFDSLTPGCYYEWAIFQAKDLERTGDPMEAAGWKILQVRPEDE